MTAPRTVPVEIAGPNLNSAKESGRFHVHVPGCADLKRRIVYRGIEPTWTIEASTVREVVEAIYSDHIAEGSMTWESGVSDVTVFPCVGQLPADEPPPPPAKATKAAKVKATPAPAASRPAVEAEAPDAAEKFDRCPRCGFAFPKPQTHCRSQAACDNRAAALVATTA